MVLAPPGHPQDVVDMALLCQILSKDGQQPSFNHRGITITEEPQL
jgi:hypothetical protein